MTVEVVCADERPEQEVVGVPLDVERWRQLACRALASEDADGELTVTFVGRAEIAELNAEHMGETGPTDVLSFPLDGEPTDGVPTLLGDIVICAAVAEAQFPVHAGTFDDEIALLVVHGVLHVLGHDHADAAEAVRMRAREHALLVEHHWHGDAPSGFRHDHD